jgi:hypothetical protein
MSEEQPIAPHGDGRHATFWTPLFLAWLLALLATAGALFLGEVMGKTPCVLCWYQRIAMFPLVLVLGLGLFASDARSVRYALPLAGRGMGHRRLPPAGLLGRRVRRAGAVRQGIVLRRRRRPGGRRGADSACCRSRRSRGSWWRCGWQEARATT